MTSSVLGSPWIPRDTRITFSHVTCSDAAAAGGRQVKQGRCSVILDPIPSVLLDSISQQGSCSVETVQATVRNSDATVKSSDGDAKSAHEWEESLPMISDNEVQGLLQDLVDEEDEEGEEEEGDDRQIDDIATVAPTPGRQLRRRLEPDTKRRKRSTSSSTTSSSACSGTSRRHRHKHRRHRRHRSPPPPPPPPRPRVNPIFVWVKQDDTRIVEVHCEEYDKRNRIRLTKTSAGWRAIPRTERFHVPTEPTSPAAATCRDHSPERSSDNMPLDDSPDELMEAEVTKTEPVSEAVPVTSLDPCVQAEHMDEDNDVIDQVEDNALTEPAEAENRGSEPEEAEDSLTEPVEAEDSLTEPVEAEDSLTDHLEAEDSLTEHVEAEDSLTEHVEAEDSLTEHVEAENRVTEPEENVDDVSVSERDDELSEEREDDETVANHLDEDAKSEDVEVQAEPTDLTLPKSSSPRPPPSRSFLSRPPPPTTQAPQFLEALLKSPSPCHPPAAHAAPVNLPPAPRRPRVKRDVDDITLRNLLSRRPSKLVKEENLKTPLRVPTTRKSRLLELLTSEPRDDLDPLTQLKKILSDPDMAIPDPLLVPRDRLQELVSCPAKEIPRLLTLRPELRLPEALAYPGLLQDPNLLVVSISYLQSLLRSPDKRSAQPHSSLLQWQQECSQMMWLPYLSQLEAQAMFNNGYPLLPADVHAMAMWQEAMMAGMMPPPLQPPPPPLVAAPGKKRCSSARTTPLSPGFHPYPHPPRSPTMKTEAPNEKCRPTVTCKPLFNLMSSPRREEGGEKVAKLKVKEHLVDPTLRPKLLKQEVEAEVGDDKVHANLWHPLFGSQKAASYSSPWQWTTVTVNGE